MKTISLKSYAKINLSLNVFGKIDEEYHKLDSIMLPIELHDSLIVNRLSSSEDNYVTIDDYSMGVINYNLATYTIECLAKEFNFNDKFRVFIHKNIPIRSGLGGGSGNAAFTMKAVNQLLKLNISRDKMLEIAQKLGSDVPFFVDCVPARVQGKGEILTPINVKNNYYVLLIKPMVGCSTKEIFEFADTMELKTTDIDKVVSALEQGDDELLASVICNSLEEPACIKFPIIGEIKKKLKDFGLNIVQMSGSGSTVFALSTNLTLLRKAAKLFNENECFVELTKVRKS